MTREETFRSKMDAIDLTEEFEAIAKAEGTTIAEVLSESHEPHVSRARSAMWHVLRERFGWSYPAIGKLFHRDHSTIMQGLRGRYRRPTFDPGGRIP